MPKALPAKPNLTWLRKAAKHRLVALRAHDPAAKLTAAQRDIAGEYGFASWRALKAHIDDIVFTLRDHDRVFDAARSGDVEMVRRALIRQFPTSTAEPFTRSQRSDATKPSSCLPAISGQVIPGQKAKCRRSGR
jgi:hypothetical protein